MKWKEMVVWTQLITSGLMIIKDAVVLVHVCCGTQYKLVLMLEAMLLISNIGYFVNGGALYPA